MMNSPDAIPVGKRDQSRLSARVIRIVHISDTHLQHNSLSPPRPISGNISIRRSISNSSTNQIVDEVGFDAFEKQSWSTRSKSRRDSDVRPNSFCHKGGTFLSGALSASSRVNPFEIPSGDVLVHSGDFDWVGSKSKFFRSDNFEELVQSMNDFFDRFPHKLKLFVAGNHDTCFEGKNLQTIQERLISATYLFNSHITYEGVKFYGAPYTTFRFLTNARGFIRHSNKLVQHWQRIPSDTDVLITHSPPLGILDLGLDKMTRKLPKLSSAWNRLTVRSECSICNILHRGRSHMGCTALRDEILHRVKPKLHLFGHVHEGNGFRTINETIFCNSAYPERKNPHVFDYYCDF